MELKRKKRSHYTDSMVRKQYGPFRTSFPIYKSEGKRKGSDHRMFEKGEIVDVEAH